MASKTEKDRLAFEAAIRANAVSYRIHLFLGRGQFDRADAATLAEAIEIGARMKQAHPACQAEPMFYAIEASGHATVVTKAHFNEETKSMAIKIATTEISVCADVNAAAIADAKRARKNELERARRAAKKAAKESSEAPTPAPVETIIVDEQAMEAAIDARFAAPATIDLSELVSARDAYLAEQDAAEQADATAAAIVAEPPITVCPPVKALREISERRQRIQAQVEKIVEAGEDSRPRFLPEQKAERFVVSENNGLCATRAEATAAARLRYGLGDEQTPTFTVKKTARGEWFWGPYEAPSAPARKMTDEQVAAKRAEKAERRQIENAQKKERKANGEKGPRIHVANGLPANAMAQARLFKDRLDNGAKIDAIVSEFKLASQSIVRQRLQLLKLSPEVQAAVESGFISAIMGWGIALAPSDRHVDLLDQIKTGKLKTTTDVKAAGRSLKKAA